MMGVWNWQQGKRAKGRSQWNEIMCVLVFFCCLMSPFFRQKAMKNVNDGLIRISYRWRIVATASSCYKGF